MKTRNKVVFVLFVLSMSIGYYIFNLFVDVGVFREVSSYMPGECLPIEGLVGAEDIDVDSEFGLAFVSASDRINHKVGFLYIYNFKDSNVINVKLDKSLKSEFYPHGLDLFIDEQGQRFLFVVNHRPKRDTVEVFQYTGGELVHVETMENNKFKNINDLLVISRNTFYYTSDHKFSSKLAQKLEHYLRIPGGSVNLYHENNVKKIAGDIKFANGIALNKRKNLLYVASMLDNSVYVYGVEDDLEVLEFIKRIPLDFGPDNIYISPNDEIFVAGHPNLLGLSQYGEGAISKVPSYVKYWNAGSAQVMNSKTLFSDDGSSLSASSVASYFEEKLLIGSVFDDHILECEFESGEYLK